MRIAPAVVAFILKLFFIGIIIIFIIIIIIFLTSVFYSCMTWNGTVFVIDVQAFLSVASQLVTDFPLIQILFISLHSMFLLLVFHDRLYGQPQTFNTYKARNSPLFLEDQMIVIFNSGNSAPWYLIVVYH